MKKLVLSLAFVISAGIAAWFAWHPAPSAPDLSFTTLKNETFRTADLQGKVVLVKFWATSCVTCVKQMPDTVDYYLKYRQRGFDTIGVAMQYDPANYVLNFVEKRQIPFKIVLDSKGEIAQAFGDVRLTPTAFLIDRQGRIVKRYLGEYDKAEFIATLEKTLKGAA